MKAGIKIVGLHCWKWDLDELRREMKSERGGREGVVGKAMMGRGGMCYTEWCCK